jgi:hypothetical protein
MHKPSGLGVYGLYQHEDNEGSFPILLVNPNLSVTTLLKNNVPDSDVFYVKPFWRKAWSPIGATVLFGEYGQYNNQYSASLGSQCGPFDTSFGTNIDAFCNTISNGLPVGVFVNDSEIQRWGLGVVQEIDSAAMHLFARWQHQEADINFTGFDITGINTDGDFTVDRHKVSQGFEDWDLFQVGGIIFF